MADQRLDPSPARPGAGAGRARPVLVLQHAAWERPGLIAEALGDLSVVTQMAAAQPDPDLPAVRDLAGLVVLGGPQDADDDAGWPGLPAERRLLAEAVDDGLPVLGVCLGMQLLAMALGSALHRRHGVEIGFDTVHVVAPEPVLAPLGDTPTVLHWHADAVDLPAGAELLATNDRTPVQAFRAGSALGLQFHVEVDTELLAEWLHTPEMATLPAGSVRRLLADGPTSLSTLRPRALAGLSRFAEAVRARG